ncbi:hypothetical protein MPS_2315 [Mycobacterium pseudoshottsii JCM 15466]|nr:hypothetical protein MPS_2315 [Mycobacterium pseudoshottsii JCM 15466]
MGCQGGDSRLNAPGLLCHSNTSSRGASTTLEYTTPIVARYRRGWPRGDGVPDSG